jgi:hypothetical protein
MASTLQITFNTQVLDFSPLTRGRINIVYNNGVSITLAETLTTGTATSGFFKEVTYAAPGVISDSEQASNFAQSFNRDYKDVGGVKNFGAGVVGNVVTITAKSGLFTSFEYNGNVITANAVIVNGTIEPAKILTLSNSLVGSCDAINYNISSSGGTPNYTIKKDGIDIVTAWDGTQRTISLDRGVLNTISVYDSLNVLIGERTEVVPRKLIPSEFKIRSIGFVGGQDINIDPVNPVVGTTPIEYSLDGITYQQSTSYPGLLDGTYTLRIKDVYECEQTKEFIVFGTEETTIESLNFNNFSISEFNSISFANFKDFTPYLKKNYDRVLGFNDLVGIPYEVPHEFYKDDYIGTQFKSSYPFHNVTLRNCDGTKENLPFVLIQENLGAIEKVDCKLLPLGVQTGVYFDGGNEYEPFTLTVKDASEYVKFLPSWANVGQLVTIGTLGTKEIVGEGYNSDLDRRYFIVDGFIGNSISDTVQVTYNIHEYNTYEFYFWASKIKDKAQIVIEPGYSFANIDTTKIYVSKILQKIEDTHDHLLIEWEGYKNLGDMVFSSGITGIMRIKGRVRTFALGDAETSEGDDRTYSLSQTASTGYKVSIASADPKIVNKLNLVSGISVGGAVSVNNKELIRTKAIESEEKGSTNISEVTIEFAYGGNDLSIAQAEIVLNTSTGVIGSGGTGKDGIPVLLYDGKTRLIVDGGLLSVGGSFISV